MLALVIVTLPIIALDESINFNPGASSVKLRTNII